MSEPTDQQIPKSITIAQILTLRHEAAEADDLVQVAICDLALAEGSNTAFDPATYLEDRYGRSGFKWTKRTIAQILALRHEAAEADDLVQVAICDLALAEGSTAFDPATYLEDRYGGSGFEWTKRDAEKLRPFLDAEDSEMAAWDECARVIGDAEAQS